MLFTKEDGTELTIRSVERHAIRVGDATLTSSFALNADRIIGEWPAQTADQLTVDTLKPILDEKPELLVLGTGWQHQLPSRELMFGLARRGIGLEVMDTPAACRTFNILIAEGRRPAAVLLLD